MRMAAPKDIEKSLMTVLLEVDWNAWATCLAWGKTWHTGYGTRSQEGNDFSAEVGGIFVTRSRGFCDPVSRIACVEVRPGLEFRRIFVGCTHGHRSGPARVARFDTRIGSTFRRCAHCQRLHRALENVHRPAPQCELVGTVAVDLDLLSALYLRHGKADRLRPDQQESSGAFVPRRTVRKTSSRPAGQTASPFQHHHSLFRIRQPSDDPVLFPDRHCRPVGNFQNCGWG